MLLSGLGRHLAGLALVGIGQSNALSGRHLHLFGQGPHLGPVLLVGRRDDSGQQMAERVDGHVDLAALAPLRSVIADSVSASERALQRARIENHGAWLSRACLVQAKTWRKSSVRASNTRASRQRAHCW